MGNTALEPGTFWEARDVRTAAEDGMSRVREASKKPRYMSSSKRGASRALAVHAAPAATQSLLKRSACGK